MHKPAKMTSPSFSPEQMHDAIRLLAGHEPVTITVRGDCMLPLIRNKAQLQVTPTAHYWPGDVVVALSPTGIYLVHRVIGLYRRSGTFRILTQADNAQCPDTAVQPNDILGKVTGGDCHLRAVNIPFYHRVKALTRFQRFLRYRIREKLSHSS